MPVLKPPKKNKDDEPRLSILADIEKSATVRLNEYNDITAKVTEPLIKSGVLGIVTTAQNPAFADLKKYADMSVRVTEPLLRSGVLADIQRSATVLTDLANSPAFTQARDVLVTTRKITENLTTLTTPIVSRMADINKAVFEPMERLKETASVLSKVHKFDLSIRAITEATTLPITTEHWMGKAYEVEPITFKPTPQITAAITVLRERVDNLRDEIIEKVELKFQEQIDIFIEKGIIPVGIKKAECRCSKCDKLLFKVEDMSHFMRGSHKCSCGETLQIPQDLKIVPL